MMNRNTISTIAIPQGAPLVLLSLPFCLLPPWTMHWLPLHKYDHLTLIPQTVHPFRLQKSLALTLIISLLCVFTMPPIEIYVSTSLMKTIIKFSCFPLISLSLHHHSPRNPLSQSINGSFLVAAYVNPFKWWLLQKIYGATAVWLQFLLWMAASVWRFPSLCVVQVDAPYVLCMDLCEHGSWFLPL